MTPTETIVRPRIGLSGRPRGLAGLMEPPCDDGGAAPAPLPSSPPPAPLPAAPPAPPRRPWRPIVIGATTGFGLLWAIWATHGLVGIQSAAPKLVKIELAELVREYVMAEARSGAPADQVTLQTANFLKALNDAVGAHVRAGQVVLLGNAVVAGDVPDITAAVRVDVYAHVARLQPPTSTPGIPSLFSAKATGDDHGK